MTGTKIPTLSALGLAALLGLAGPALAQDETAPAEGDAAAATEADPASDLSMGTVVTENGVPEGQPYVREEFGDWALRCLAVAEGPDPCQLYQLLKDEQDNPVAEVSLFPLPEGSRAAAGATIVAPLETLLTEELTLSVDGGNTRKYPFTFCNRGGCVARIGLTQADVDLFKRGANATVSLVPAAAPDQRINLTLSLSGFTAGYTAATAPAE